MLVRAGGWSGRRTVAKNDRPRAMGALLRPRQTATNAGALVAVAVAFFAAGALVTHAYHHMRGIPGSTASPMARALQEVSAPAMLRPSLSGDVACGAHGVLWEGERRCSCFGCARGPLCAAIDGAHTVGARCILDARFGQPTMFEDYWRHAGARKTCVAAEHSLEYALTGQAMPRLIKAIENVHALAGNVRLDGNTSIIVGIGSLSLMQAAMAAGAGAASSRGRLSAPPTDVWAPPPYFSNIVDSCIHLGARALNCTHVGRPEPPAGRARAPPLVEIVTSPNNPDGRLRTQRSSRASVVVLDHAYMWPHFTPVHAPVTVTDPEQVALFTLSKLTGHASSRIGWAVVRKGSRLESLLRAFVARSTVGIPRDAQHRAVAALEAMVADRGGALHWAQQTMAARWQTLAEIFSAHAPPPATGSAFRLQQLEPARLDRFLHTVRQPSPAYAWLERIDGQSAHVALKKVGILARPGTSFGSEQRFARLSLLMRSTEFDVLARKLRQLGPAARITVTEHS